MVRACVEGLPLKAYGSAASDDSERRSLLDSVSLQSCSPHDDVKLSVGLTSLVSPSAAAAVPSSSAHLAPSPPP